MLLYLNVEWDDDVKAKFPEVTWMMNEISLTTRRTTVVNKNCSISQHQFLFPLYGWHVVDFWGNAMYIRMLDIFVNKWTTFTLASHVKFFIHRGENNAFSLFLFRKTSKPYVFVIFGDYEVKNRYLLNDFLPIHETDAA